MSEVTTTKPIWFEGKPIDPGTVIDLPEVDAIYLVGIGRAVRVTDEKPADEKPARKKAK